METIDPAAASIREMGEDIVKLHLSGDRIKALGKAEDLARAHQGSPMALILFADLLREAARQVDRKDLKDRLNKDAEEAYGKAAGMLPNCIDTKVCHGEILVELERFDMAEVLLTSALESENPIDPAEHILTYGVSRPLRSTPATRIRDVRKRAMKARERNRENLAHIVDSRVELVLAIQERNVALKRAAGLASIYPFSVRVHLLHAHMTMRFVHSLPDRLHKTSLNRVLTVLDKDQTCDFQKSVVVFLFRAKVLYLLREYAASEQLCSHALMIKDSDDPALQDIPPGSVWGCDREERISTCRAQLSWLLVKLVAESIAFSLTPSNQQERVFFFSLASLRQHYHGSNSVAVKVLFAAEKQFNLHNTCIAWMCPCCKRRNLATPEALLEHIITVHVAHLPQKAMLGTVVKAFEGNKAAVLVDWPSDELVYDADSKTFRFEDVFSVVKSVTESHLEIPFVDSLQKKRFQAAKIYEKIEQLLLSSPTECSAIEV
jgi:tetratricopeptide (TPR) repeat protein